jgi:hypothetical protein
LDTETSDLGNQKPQRLKTRRCDPDPLLLYIQTGVLEYFQPETPRCIHRQLWERYDWQERKME